MDIEILKKFINTKKIGKRNTEGLSMDEIESLELTYNNGNNFPKAYREYLFIGGKKHGLRMPDKGFGYDWLQEESKKVLEEYNQVIERPFFVIDQLDGCEQFLFFYLDENNDDPIIYSGKPAYVEDGYELITPVPEIFSDFINSAIDSAIGSIENFERYANK